MALREFKHWQEALSDSLKSLHVHLVERTVYVVVWVVVADGDRCFLTTATAAGLTGSDAAWTWLSWHGTQQWIVVVDVRQWKAVRVVRET